MSCLPFAPIASTFDTQQALFSRYSTFDPATLVVDMEFGELDEKLESMEADVGIDQGWDVVREVSNGRGFAVEGYQAAMEKTLQDRIEDIDDANRSGQSWRSDFSQSTGNSTNNLTATARMAFTHKKRALHNINLVLQNDQTNKRSRIAAMMAQLNFFQMQLAAQDLGQGLPLVPTPGETNAINETSMDTNNDAHDDPMDLQGRGWSSDSEDTTDWSIILLDLQEQCEQDDTNPDPQGLPEDELRQSFQAWNGSVTRLGRAGARCWDDDAAVAAQMAIRFEGCRPNNKAWVAVKGLSGAKVVRKALATLRNDPDEGVGAQGTVKDRSLHVTGKLTQLQLSLGQGSGVPSALFCLTQQRVLADIKLAYHAKNGSSSVTLLCCKMPPPALDGSSVNGGKVHK